MNAQQLLQSALELDAAHERRCDALPKASRDSAQLVQLRELNARKAALDGSAQAKVAGLTRQRLDIQANRMEVADPSREIASIDSKIASLENAVAAVAELTADQKTVELEAVEQSIVALSAEAKAERREARQQSELRRADDVEQLFESLADATDDEVTAMRTELSKMAAAVKLLRRHVASEAQVRATMAKIKQDAAMDRLTPKQRARIAAMTQTVGPDPIASAEKVHGPR